MMSSGGILNCTLEGNHNEGHEYDVYDIVSLCQREQVQLSRQFPGVIPRICPLRSFLWNHGRFALRREEL